MWNRGGGLFPLSPHTACGFSFAVKRILEKLGCVTAQQKSAFCKPETVFGVWNRSGGAVRAAATYSVQIYLSPQGGFLGRLGCVTKRFLQARKGFSFPKKHNKYAVPAAACNYSFTARRPSGKVPCAAKRQKKHSMQTENSFLFTIIVPTTRCASPQAGSLSPRGGFLRRLGCVTKRQKRIPCKLETVLGARNRRMRFYLRRATVFSEN